MKAKRTGYVAGFPDVFCYDARGGYHGLALELKVKGNYASQKQKNWIKRLNERGYMAKVCTGFDDAKKFIDDYYDLEKNKKIIKKFCIIKNCFIFVG